LNDRNSLKITEVIYFETGWNTTSNWCKLLL